MDDKYKDAIEEALIVQCIFTEELAADPKKAIAALIEWNVRTALDPAVSAAASNLILKGRLEVFGEAVAPTEKALDQMEAIGGSFIKSLAACWYRADARNRGRLERTFSDWFEHYNRQAESWDHIKGESTPPKN